MTLSREFCLAAHAGVIHDASIDDDTNRHLEWIHRETGATRGAS